MFEHFVFEGVGPFVTKTTILLSSWRRVFVYTMTDPFSSRGARNVLITILLGSGPPGKRGFDQREGWCALLRETGQVVVKLPVVL